MKRGNKRIALALSFLSVLASIVAAPGLATAVSSCDSLAGNLVANCGFETGSFASWTQFGNTGFNGVDGNPHTGDFAGFFGPVGSDGGITQNIPTVVGTQYVFQAWELNDGGTPNHFKIEWDGVVALDSVNGSAHPYAPFTFVETATLASTPIRFTFRDDPGFLFLDDVVVCAVGTACAAALLTAVPEPGTLMLLGTTGVLGVCAALWRRRIS